MSTPTQSRAWRIAHRDEKRAYDLVHRDEHLAYEARWRMALKLGVFDAYGGCHCSWPGCTITDPDMLEIDHINSDGAEHRRMVGAASGKQTYLWLKRNRYPGGFQVLCSSHNRKKQLMLARGERPPVSGGENMCWAYIESEPGLYTVGYFVANGTIWRGDSDWDTREAARERVHFLNGGSSDLAIGKTDPGRGS